MVRENINQKVSKGGCWNEVQLISDSHPTQYLNNLRWCEEKQ